MPEKKGGLHDTESLQNIAQRLGTVRDRLLALRDGLQTPVGKKLGKLWVLGHPSMIRGLEFLEHFADQGHRAFQEALTKEGQFEAQDTPPKARARK